MKGLNEDMKDLKELKSDMKGLNEDMKDLKELKSDMKVLKELKCLKEDM